MTGLREMRRRRTRVVLGASLAALLLLPVSVVIAWRAIRDSKAAEAVVSIPMRTLPLTPTAVVGVTDEQNFLASLAVVALAPDGAGGTVILLPVGSSVGGQPEGEPKRLADVYGSDGAEALKKAVEDISNSQIDLVSVTGVDGVAELIARAGTLAPTFANDVTDTENEKARVVAVAGANSFTPIYASAVLAARDASQNEESRFSSVKALWESVAAAVGDGALGAVPATVVPDVGAQTPADVPAFMSALLSGPIRVWQIGGQRISDAEKNPKDIDVYGYNVGELVMVMASAAPSAMVPVYPTLSVQIDSPYPDSAVIQESVFRMLYMGTNVILVRAVDETPPAMTTMYYEEEIERAMAQPLTTLFGDIEFEKATEGVEGVDVRLVLGENFIEFLRDEPSGGAASSDETTIP
ncbi:MAG: hypothetical protein ACKOCE_06055 [Acidimicrobiia bacterium]